MSRRRVLIADREPDVADTLATVLSLHGLEAVAVYTGSDALDVISRDSPDASVLGLDLPGVSGYEVARRVRQAGHRMLLVALTGYGDQSRVTAVLSAGFDHHLLKPALPDDILRLLRPPAGDGPA